MKIDGGFSKLVFLFVAGLFAFVPHSIPAQSTFDDKYHVTESLYLCRETDWEASPRTHTIVYAGLGDHKTYWGKKKNN